MSKTLIVILHRAKNLLHQTVLLRPLHLFGDLGRIAGPDDEHVGFPVREFGGTHGPFCNDATRRRGHT